MKSGERGVAEVVEQSVGEPDPAGHVVEVPERGRGQHRPDVGRQGHAGGREAAADPRSQRHRGQEAHDSLQDARARPDRRRPRRVERRPGARATARGRRPKPRPGTRARPGAAGFRPARSMRRVPIGPPMMPPDTMPTIAEATASDAAPVTPAASKSGANARPVAGPPVSVTEPASTPRSGGTPRAAATAAPTRFCEHRHRLASARNTCHGRAALAQQRHARAEADRGEERDHQRRLQRRVEADGLVAGRAKQP